jgi:hypothetical protein
MVILFFDCRLNAEDCNRKISARGEFALFLYKIVIIISLTFFDSFSRKIVIGMIFLGSWALFLNYSINYTHFDYYLSKIIIIQHACNAWTSLLLVLAEIAKEDVYD